MPKVAPASTDVLAERRGQVLWLYLNRPERLNSFDRSMADELRTHIEEEKEAGVIVITGSGRGFCAGGYLGSLEDPQPSEIRRLYRSSLLLLDAIRLCGRPVIAAVNGPAAGGGNELVVACDLAIAARSATLGQVGPRIGSSPVLGGANHLAAIVGEKRAKEVAFLCRRYTAEQALAYGWVNAVVDDDRLEDETTAWAEELLVMSPRYLEITKIMSNVWWNQQRDNYLTGIGMLIQAIGSHDMKEGARAFMEKRPARFAPLEADLGSDQEGTPDGDGTRPAVAGR